MNLALVYFPFASPNVTCDTITNFKNKKRNTFLIIKRIFVEGLTQNFRVSRTKQLGSDTAINVKEIKSVEMFDFDVKYLASLTSL